MRQQTERQNRLISEGLYSLAADPTQTYVPPVAKDAVPFLNFAPVQNAVARLEKVAKQYDDALTTKLSNGALTESNRRELDRVLITTERVMTRPEGLPRRPWFKHQVYAPGFYTGYGVKTLPGIREAIEQRDWTEAAEQMEYVAAALNRVSDAIEGAATILGST